MTNEPYTEETAGQIDPQNPFENALENAAYRTDYRRFLPQILLPDFHIPLFPEREERSRIRRQMNTAGAGALLGCMGSQLLFPLTIMVLLLCMDGLGWYQEAGKRAQALHPGDVVTIPAGVKHWHGAQKDCWFSHIAIECPGEETSNEWLEPVTDAEYAALDADCAQNP